MTRSPLDAWDSFYVIVGSSAAALTGLQFVVMTLVAASNRPGGPKEIAAFGTPTVVHFGAVLLVGAILSAPWSHLSGPALAIAVCGLGGLAYAAIIIRRAHRVRGYTPVFEDWLWHTMLPPLAYGALVLAALFLPRAPMGALFAIGGAALLLLFVGIHNSWDTVTYIATDVRFRSPPPPAAPAPPAAADPPR